MRSLSQVAWITTHLNKAITLLQSAGVNQQNEFISRTPGKYLRHSIATIPGKIVTMTLIEFLVLLVIAAICGSIGQSLAGYDLGGCLVSSVVGFIGAYIGMWLAGRFGLPELLAIKIGGKIFPIIWSVIGSAVLTLIVALIRRGISGPRRY